METIELIFKVRNLSQTLNMPKLAEFWSTKAKRKEAKKIFTQRGFIDLKLSEVKFIN